jgi:hypothetical protein
MSFGKRPDRPAAPADADAPQPEFSGAKPAGPGAIQIGDGGGSQKGAERVAQFLVDAYRDERGVHAETVLSAVGALAGFAAQEAIWEGCVRPGRMQPQQALMRVDTKSGETYFFGDFLNTIVATTQPGQLSVWRFVAGAALKAGTKSLPQLEPIFAHSAETVGTPDFGIPVLPSNVALKEMPRQALRHWPRVKAILVTADVQPLHWPLELGVAAQLLLKQAKDTIPPDIGALVVMQAAIPMSKVDPRTVPGGTIVE